MRVRYDNCANVPAVSLRVLFLGMFKAKPGRGVGMWRLNSVFPTTLLDNGVIEAQNDMNNQTIRSLPLS